MRKKWFLLFGILLVATRLNAADDSTGSGSNSGDHKKIEQAVDLVKQQAEYGVLGLADNYKPTQADVDNIYKIQNQLDQLYPDKTTMPNKEINKLAAIKLEAEKKSFRKYFKTQEAENKAFNGGFIMLGTTEKSVLNHSTSTSISPSGTSSSKNTSSAKVVSPIPASDKEDLDNEPVITATPTPHPDEVQKTLDNTVGNSIKHPFGL